MEHDKRKDAWENHSFKQQVQNKEFYHKRSNNPKEEGKEEHTPEPLERD